VTRRRGFRRPFISTTSYRHVLTISLRSSLVLTDKEPVLFVLTITRFQRKVVIGYRLVIDFFTTHFCWPDFASKYSDSDNADRQSLCRAFGQTKGSLNVTKTMQQDYINRKMLFLVLLCISFKKCKDLFFTFETDLIVVTRSIANTDTWKQVERLW